MTKPEPPTFHLRLPSEIKKRLESAKGKNSLNREIVERLRRSLEPDPALEFAQVVRPFFATLDEAGREKVMKMAADAVGILAERRSKRKPRS